MYRFKLGGKEYIGDGDPILQPVSEFNTGIRLGAPSLDDRNLASFFAFEDARGGIGVHIGETREDKDKVADTDGLLMFKFNQMIKPPLMSTQAMTGATKGLASVAVVKEMLVDATRRMFVGFAHLLYYSNGTTAALTKTTADPHASGTKITSLVTYTEPTAGTKRCYVGNDNDVDAVYFTDPTVASPFTTARVGMKAETFFVWDGRLWAHNKGIMKWTITPIDADWNTAAAVGAWPNHIRFIGVFPFGQTSYPYVLCEPQDPGQAYLAILDLDGNQVLPINLGVAGIQHCFATKDGIGVVCNFGRDLLVYNPQAQSIINADWRAQTRDGFLSARDGSAIAGAGFQRGNVLFNNLDDSTYTQMFLHTGTGWAPYGKAVAGTAIEGGVYIPHLQALVVPVKPAGADLQLNTIPWWNEVYTPGVDQSVLIETSDLTETTPWFSMGFSDIEGAALLMQHGGFADANNKIVVEYQLDFDESSWSALGTLPNILAATVPEISTRTTPVENTKTLLFERLVGVPFTWIRFRFTLQSLDPNQSPNAYPLTFRFFKRPKMRDSVRVNVLIDATLGARGDIQTVDDLFSELKTLYDTPTVPELEVGSVHTWAQIIQMPRLITIEEMNEQDIAVGKISTSGSVAINLAELL